MKQISFEECKKIELDILIKVAEFCDANDLRYFITYGTLIGAVRHKGFIPWDDDIDITMPRADYNKLIEIFNEKNQDERYYLVSPQDKLSKHSYAKIIDTRTVKIETGFAYPNGYLGVDIDIFPMDGMPEDENEYIKWYNKLNKTYIKFMRKTTSIKNSPLLKTKLGLMLVKPFIPSPKKCLEKARKLHELYPYETSNFVGSIESWVNGPGNRAPKECYDSFVWVEFEGLKFKAPVGFDEVLTRIYGNYMKLPPVEKQVTHHVNNTYWKENENE